MGQMLCNHTANELEKNVDDPGDRIGARLKFRFRTRSATKVAVNYFYNWLEAHYILISTSIPLLLDNKLLMRVQDNQYKSS